MLTRPSSLGQSCFAGPEDRALLGSNLSAVTGPRRKDGAAVCVALFCLCAVIVDAHRLISCTFRIGVNAENPGGLGAKPPICPQF